MKKASVLFAVVIALIFASNAFAAGGLQWFSLQEGMEKAKAEKKPMIVDFFYGKGCPRCEFLQKNVYDNPKIAKKIMEDFVPIRVDLTRKLTKDEEALGNKYDFKNDCLLLFLDPQANIIKEKGKRLCFVDKIDPDAFIEYLDTVKAELPK
jgi:thiol:disulfide interchange protein